MPFIITVQTGHGDDAQSGTYDSEKMGYGLDAIKACQKAKSQFSRDNRVRYSAVRVMRCCQKEAS